MLKVSFRILGILFAICSYVGQSKGQHKDSVLQLPSGVLPVIRNAMIDSIQQSLDGKKFLDSIVVYKSPPALPGLELQDSVRTRFFQFIAASGGKEKLKSLSDGFNVLQDTSRTAAFIDRKLRGFYALTSSALPRKNLTLPNHVENKLGRASLELSTGDSLAMAYGFGHRVNLQDVLTIGSIPLAMNYVNITGQDPLRGASLDGNLVKFSFDKEAYLENINQHIQQNFDLKKYFLEDLDFKANLQKLAREQMDEYLDSGGLQSLANELRQKVDPQQLLYLDSVQLRNLVMSAINTDQLSTDSLQLLANERFVPGDSLSQKVDIIREQQELYLAKLMQLKRQYEAGLKAKEMLASQFDAKYKVQDYLSDKQRVPGLAKELIPMNGLQRLLMKFESLDIGNFSTTASKGTVSDLFMGGVAGKMMSNNTFFMAAIGKRQDADLRANGLAESLEPETFAMQFLSVGKGFEGQPNTRISALNANAKPTNRGSFNTATISQNIFVGAASKTISLGEYGDLEAEFSKSSSQFASSNTNATENSSVTKAAVGQFLDDFWLTTSINLRYTGEVQHWKMQQSAYVGYSGMGYNNPGNPYARKGLLQFGLNVRKYWQKNKAMVNLRADMRNMAQSAVGRNQWKSLQFALDSRYKLSRKLSMTMRLQQSTMDDQQEAHTKNMFINRKVSFSTTYRGRLHGKSFTNNTTVGLQQLDYETALAPINSRFINLNTVQVFMLGTNMLTYSLFYNKDIRGESVYADLLTTDLGYHYTLWKKWNLGTALTYLRNAGVVEQAGLRQQLNTQFFKRCNVNLNVDVRKSLMNTSLNYLYGNFRAECAFYYQLN